MNTEYEYNIKGPDEDGDYFCEDCGHSFALREGEPLECPICKQINEGPELDPCPFCGSENVILDWEMRDPDRWDNHHQIQARCRGCGAETDLFETAAEAGARWNRRPRTKRFKSRGMEPCPFCAGSPTVEKFRDYEWDECYNAYYYVAFCKECGNRTDHEEGPEWAVQKWNARADPTDDKDHKGGA